MGRRDKKGATNSSAKFKKIPKHLKSKINPVVQALLDKCTSLEKVAKKEFEEYKEIYALVQKIRGLEKDYVIPLPKRTNWEQFYQWCEEHGAVIDGVTVKELGDGEVGVFAEKDLVEDDLYFLIPRKIMMSETSALESKLGPIIKENPIMQHMPNVMLAVFLLMEIAEEKSFWAPYMSVLPTNFNTILYFDVEEMELLQKTTIFEEALNFYRSIARQYAYFQQLFQHSASARALKIGEYFTYDLYRWAVSVVMTRQNFVPSPAGSSVVAALIPLWDMCNHATGKASSDFNLENDCLEAYTMKDFKAGEEVTMFYGQRTNGSFFLHNGFVYPPNESDAFTLKLGVSKSDPLCSRKTDLCKKQGLTLNGSFELSKSSLIDKNLLTFLKINILKEDELDSVSENEALLDDESEKCKDITRRALNFLKDRATLILKCFKTTIEEDKELIESTSSPRKKLALQIRLCEKQMLQDIIDECTKMLTD